MIVTRPELTLLQQGLDQVVTAGIGTTIFLTGEPGIGKSTLAAHFLDHCDSGNDRNILTATGHCLDLDGVSRGYLPWKEVLIELDADRAAGNDAEKKQSFKTIIKTLFDESSTEWMQNIPQIGEISSAVLETAKAIQHAEEIDVSTGETRELNFRQRLRHVVSECTGAWLGAIPVVGGLVEAVFKTSKLLMASRMDVQLKSQEDFFQLVMHRLRLLANDNPAIVFLDDLQWADASSLNLFFYLAKNLNDKPYPLLLIGSYRPEDVRQGRRNPQSGAMERHPLEEKLNALKRYDAAREIALGQFDRSQIETYLTARFGTHEFDHAFVDELLHATNGNILFVQEMLTNLIERGFVSEHEGAWHVVEKFDYSQMPGTIEGVINERYERLSDELREVLMVAAVEGEEFALEIIESILQQNRIKLHQHLYGLIHKHGLIHESSKAYEKLTRIYEFTHNLVQKYIYHSIDEGFRRDLHRAIAETLKAMLNVDQMRPWKAHYAFHLGIGFGIIDEQRRILVDEQNVKNIPGGIQQLTEFLQLDIDLANDAIASYNNTEALMLCDEVLEIARILADDPTAMIFLGKKSRIFAFTGAWSEAEAAQRECLAKAIELGNKSFQANAYMSLGWLMHVRGDFAASLEETSRARDLYVELGLRSGEAQAIGILGTGYQELGEYDRAMECYRQQRLIAEEEGDRSGVGQAVLSIGLACSDHCEYDHAMEYYEQSLAIFKELGNRPNTAVVILAIANAFNRRGEYDHAMEYYQQSLAIFEELGDRRDMSQTIGDIGSVYADRGEYELALECYERGLAIAEDLGDRASVAHAIGNIGIVCAHRGEYNSALEYLDRALQQHRELGIRKAVVLWLLDQSRLLLTIQQQATMPTHLPRFLPGATVEEWRAISLSRARECAEECVAISDELSKPDTQFSGKVVLARIGAAEGDVDGAVEQLSAMLAEATDDAEQAQLHYWLWKLGTPGHAAAALTLYETLYATIPKQNYREYIEELRAAGEESRDENGVMRDE